MNLFDAQLEQSEEEHPAGYRGVGFLRLGERIGARLLGMTVYELPPGQSICPYHWETDEEWLFVLRGRPTVRVPDGEHELEPGDVVCFPAGPAGAHKVTNRTDEPLRVSILSTKRQPSVAGYPDSDKVGVWTDGVHGKLFRLGEAVDYYDGEA